MTDRKNRQAVALIRLIIAGFVGVGAGIGAYSMGANSLSLLIGWDVAVLLFLIWIWSIIWPLGHQETARHALKEDPTRAGADLILILASIASLGAVGIGLLEAHGAANANERLLLTVFSIFSVVLAWVLIHTVYTLRYARLYYSASAGSAVDFLDDKQPSYADFIYLAFTIGMTFQISDTNLKTTEFRKTVLRHSLLSYLFGTVIIASTISLITSIGQ